MTIKEIITYTLQASLFVLVMSIGLQSRWTDVLYVVRRPTFFFRAIVAVNVIVPAVAIAMCLILPIAPWTKVGLIAMAVSPGAPFAPLKMLKGGAERSYAVGVYVALMVAAVVVMPLTAAILNPLAPRGVVIPVPVVGGFVIETVMLPLLIGVAVRALWPGGSERAAPLLRKASLAILLPAVLLLLIKFSREFLPLIGDGTLFAIAATIAAGLAAGVMLGGPDASSRNALGDAAATRHPGLAAAIAQLHSNDPRVLAAIVLYLFASIAFSAAFARLFSNLGFRPVRTAASPHP